MTRFLNKERSVSTRMNPTSRLLVMVCALAGLLLTVTIGSLHEVRSEEAPRSYAQARAVTETAPVQKADLPIPVSGRVVDPRGKPVAGAKIYVLGALEREAVPKVRAVTDARGEFAFDMRRDEFALNDSGSPWHFSQIMASARGYGADFRPAYFFDPSGRLARDQTHSPFVAGDRWDRTLRLAADDVPIEGKIVDENGQPVAGVTVRAAGIWVPKAEDLSPFLAAIDEGEDYDVVVHGMMDRYVFPGGLLGTAVTGPDGRFRLLGGMGRERLVRVHISGPNIVSEFVFVRTRPGPTLSTLHIVESPRSGKVRYFGSTFEFRARRSVPIVGSVTDKVTELPVPGVSIRCRAGALDQELLMEFDEGGVRTVTDAHGRYRLTGAPPGADCLILAVPSGQPYLPAAKPILVRSDQPLGELDFALAPGTKIGGRIIDGETGAPVRAQVTYFLPLDNPRASAASNMAMIVPWQEPFVTNGDGDYANVGVPGRGWLAVLPQDHRRYSRGVAAAETREKHPGWPMVMLPARPTFCVPENYNYVSEVEIPEDAENYRYDIVLTPEKPLTGKLVDPDGRPLAGATCGGITDTDGLYFVLTTDVFKVLNYQPDKPRQLMFVHRDRKVAGGYLLQGPQNEAITVKLESWGTICGRIVDAAGKPLAKALIRGYAPGRGNRPGSGDFPERHYWTDGEGRFRIGTLIPCLKYDLEIIDDGKIVATTARGFTVGPGETRDLGDVEVKPQ